ncbi:MAG: precorrin-3B C(17)-methyltransferase [Acidimicrobiales bacterium]
MTVLCLSATEPGRAIAGRLPYRHLHGDVGGSLRRHWDGTEAFVVVLAVGATVRLIAPLLAGKDRDPAVVCVDDAGRFAVAVCGGHAAGANDLAEQVAALLGAEPVVTTATDRLGVPALDRVPGTVAEGDVAAVTAAVLAGRPVAVEDVGAWPRPPALDDLAARPGAKPAGRIVVTDRAAPPPGRAGLPTVLLRPRSLVVGVGTSTDASPEEVAAAVASALTVAALSPRAVERVATVDRRLGHPAVEALTTSLGVPLVGFAPAELDAVDVPTPSPVVRAAVRTGSVAEAAALLGAGPDAELVAPKHVSARVTVAVARRLGPAGSVAVVGLGPGAAEHRTPAAERAVRRAEIVVGFDGYLAQCQDLLSPGQTVRPYPLGAELERARDALAAAAAGRTVALVCSGDAGVYAMASPLLELAGEQSADGTVRFAGVDVTIVPGVTAALASAALLGAPLGHDHAAVSLSDHHTAWDRIAARVQAAAEADLVLALYNPRSRRRTWQLDKALAVLRAHRPPTTPVGLVTDACRPGQRVVHTTLAEVTVEEVTMTTCVVVGSSTTRMVAGRMVTPRGYDR